MPDGPRRRARVDHGSLPGDARKRRRQRQRRDARRTRVAILVFVIVGLFAFGGIFGVAAMAVFVDHLPKLSTPRADRARRELHGLLARLHQEALQGRGTRA